MIKTTPPSHTLPLVLLLALAAGPGCGPAAGPEHGHDHHAELEAPAGPAAAAEPVHAAVEMSDAEQEEHGIEVAVAGPGPLGSRLELPGEVRVNGDRMAHVTPRVGGIAVEVFKSLGDRVREGELLAVLDSRELADLHADYLAASAQLELAEARFAREERLKAQRVSSEEDFLDARAARAEARIALRSASQKLEALGFAPTELAELPHRHETSFTRYRLTAPFAGEIIDRHLTRGEAIEADTAVFTVADLSAVWVDLNVYQKDLGAVHAGQEVELVTDHGHRTTAAIRFVQPLVGEATRTALARIEVANTDGHWHPGCFVTGTVATAATEVAVRVPREAVVGLDDDGRPSVFVADEHGFEARPVELGRGDSRWVEVVAGLDPGERYAARGAFVLKAELGRGSLGHGHAH